MFDEPLIDPTAGERARAIHEHPEWPQPILDPTDPRHGSVPRRPPTGARPEREAEPAPDAG